MKNEQEPSDFVVLVNLVIVETVGGHGPKSPLWSMEMMSSRSWRGATGTGSVGASEVSAAWVALAVSVALAVPGTTT